MMSIGSIMTYAMNIILIAFSTTATAVFGVYFKLHIPSLWTEYILAYNLCDETVGSPHSGCLDACTDR